MRSLREHPPWTDWTTSGLFPIFWVIPARFVLPMRSMPESGRRKTRDGAQIVVLPELFSTGYSLDEFFYPFSEHIPQLYTANEFGGIAKENQVCIIRCIIIIESGENKGLCYDTAFLVGPEGSNWNNTQGPTLASREALFCPWQTRKRCLGSKIR